MAITTKKELRALFNDKHGADHNENTVTYSLWLEDMYITKKTLKQCPGKCKVKTKAQL